MSRALETVLRKFPVEASTMLADGGVLKQVGVVVSYHRIFHSDWG